MPTYRKYETDEKKAEVYQHRVKQAERKADKVNKGLKEFFRRYEAGSGPMVQSADGHDVAGSIPMFVGNIDSQYSAMTAVDVEFSLQPKGATTDDQAYVATEALNQEFTETKSQERGNLCVKDSLIGGLGWVKVGYEYEEEETEVPRPSEDIRNEIRRLIEEGAGAEGGPDPEYIASQVPLTQTETEELVDRIVVDYVAWDCVLVDPTAKVWQDVMWVAQKQLMTKDEITANPAFVEYAKSRRQSKKLTELKADTELDQKATGTDERAQDDERYTVYTLWDFRTGTVCTFAKDQKWLLYETVNPFSIFPDTEDQNPFVPLVLRRTSARLRGISESEVLKPVLEQEDLYDSKLATYLERMSPKYIAEEGIFTAAGKEAMKSQEYGAVVETRSGSSPKDSVIPVQPPQLMAEMFQMSDRLSLKGRDATGLSEIQRGLFPDRKRTATETSSVVQAAATRASEKRIALTNFWHAIGRRILVLMQMYYETPRILHLSDEAGEVQWQFEAKDIAHSFNFEVHITPREEMSWQERTDRALGVLNVVGPMAAPGPDGSSPANVTELLRYILTEMHIPRRIIHRILNLPEQQQSQVLGALQNTAQQATAAQGAQPAASAVPGPLDADTLAAATNQGTIPPEILAAAGGPSPAGPQGAEQVSESRGVAGLR